MPYHHLHHGVAPPPQPQPPPPKPNPKLLSLILKAIIMTLITSFFFLLLGIASLLLLPLLLATHYHHDHHHRPNPSNGFSPEHLKKLPQFRCVKGTTIKTQPETEECVVCLDGFKGGQWCRKLVGCGHVFHRKCVDTWLVKVSACPICRTRV